METLLMVSLYLIRVMRVLKRQLSSVERDMAVKFFYSGYSVNYTAEYLR